MSFKEVLFILGDSIFIEEVFKDLFRISWKVSWGDYIPFNRSKSPEMNSGRSQKSTREEERIIEIKEMTKEPFAHGM